MSNHIIYVVTAYRWGDHEKHSYVVGAYDNYEGASDEARLEEMYRGGKYECEIVQVYLNKVLPYNEDEFEL